jgi:beta-1,4-mannosyl-glycoprotein beta-1,4-N-acetylglucosaminyltransferase
MKIVSSFVNNKIHPDVYDCFSFFNEFDVLELRLHYLSSVVDKFILVEANKTFSNKPKPLYFEENKSRFAPFLDKIVHIKITEYPSQVVMDNAWAIESYQRNSILEGLKNCKPEDIIIISDVDEIPTRDVITRYKTGELSGISKLDQMRCNYYINYRAIIRPWYGSNILTYRDILENNADKYSYIYSTEMVESLNQGTTLTKIRLIRNGVPVIRNAGWHFSFLGGLDKIIYKLTSFAHHTDYEREYTDKNLLIKRIKNGVDLFKPENTRFIPIKIDHRFPQYLVDNQEKYAHLIYHDISFWHNFFTVVTFSVYLLFFWLPLQWFKRSFKNTSWYKKIKSVLKRTKV